MTKLLRDEERNIPSPFRRVIATGYYDGPTEGLALGSEDDVYCFTLLDWDDGQDVRIFRLSIVPGISIEDTLTALETVSPPTWPVWVLPAVVDPDVEAFIRNAHDKAQPTAVIATSNLLGTIDLWRCTTEGEQLIATKDWLSELGFPRKGSG